MKIPEYYRQFQSTSDEEKKTDKPVQDQKALGTPKPKSGQDSAKLQQAQEGKDKTIVYQGNGFTVDQLEDWIDNTIYTLNGPVTDGIQHNVILTIDKDVPFENINEYAEWQIQTLENELKGCTLLKQGEIKLNDGTDAYEAVFSWFPVEDFRIYQHQVYTLIDKNAYKLTASFTKKTWKTLGPAVLRMMLSFKVNKK